MSGRPNKRQDIDLSTLLDPVNGQRFECGFAIIQLIGCFLGGVPITPAGLEFTFDDSPTFYPYAPGFKLQTPDGAEKFSSFTVRGPLQVGTLVVMFTDDPIPLLSGAGFSGDPSAGKWLDLWYGPHVPLADGSAISTTGMARGGVPYLNFIGTRNVAPGTPPQQYWVKGRPAIATLTSNGMSGVALDFCIPWVRSKSSGLYLHPSAKHQSWHVEAEVDCQAAGGTDGLGAGIYLTPTDGVVVNEGVPDGAGPNCFFGVVRNGAGGWKVAARAINAGPLTLSDDISSLWPASVTASVRVHIGLTDADPIAGVDGTVSVFLNEKLVRFYSDPSVFPDSHNGTGLAGAQTYRVLMTGKGPIATNLHYADVELWSSRGRGVAQ